MEIHHGGDHRPIIQQFFTLIDGTQIEVIFNRDTNELTSRIALPIDEVEKRLSRLTETN